MDRPYCTDNAGGTSATRGPPLTHLKQPERTAARKQQRKLGRTLDQHNQRYRKRVSANGMDALQTEGSVVGERRA